MSSLLRKFSNLSTKSKSSSTSTSSNLAPAAPIKMSKIAVVVWSAYGHVASISEKVVEGAKSTGATVDVYQFPETLSEEVLGKLHANKAPIASFPVITPDKLKEYDGFLLGFPTRYGRAPAQVSAFFDQTGGLWATGALIGKFAGTFTSTASQHGGNETTHLTTIPFFVHQGINYVPHGYRNFAEQTNLEQIHGASAYGAGTIAAGDGSRQPIDLDFTIAKSQGEHFANVVNTYVKGKSA
ncbi:NADPH-dependent FMN reductase-like protein [Kalmanozyma brasiliensis GHG001]|uniref:Protoplast secreted protein 2 n=1 Tax=Kalmanozyma brasiliensis (strain GHG001) TaxID=1365824 RepID=V5E4J4_KALBG|nr:NADPH-dependent FMN reductase-like protein [Kalmanozyma brasiliensis GHG001]EST05091.1 NADPH-dependent FMN reductase-like protein [Kalmanozyma brasiliensis GHG001]